MNYLTVEQVLFVHMRLISETGGATGIRDLEMLASAVARPQATFEGRDLYPDLSSKAAALMESLVRNHPFIDGNKRVGITAAGLFLRLNGYGLAASSADLGSFTMQVARSELVLAQISAWFRTHSAAL